MIPSPSPGQGAGRPTLVWVLTGTQLLSSYMLSLVMEIMLHSTPALPLALSLSPLVSTCPCVRNRFLSLVTLVCQTSSTVHPFGTSSDSLIKQSYFLASMQGVVIPAALQYFTEWDGTFELRISSQEEPQVS